MRHAARVLVAFLVGCVLLAALVGCAHVAPFAAGAPSRTCPRPVTLVLCVFASCRDIGIPDPAPEPPRSR